MKALDNKVNIIPIIAKADTITKQELHKFKLKVCETQVKEVFLYSCRFSMHRKKSLSILWFQQVMSELVSNGVRIYQFPVDDETVAEVNSSMNVSWGHSVLHLFVYVQERGWSFCVYNLHSSQRVGKCFGWNAQTDVVQIGSNTTTDMMQSWIVAGSLAIRRRRQHGRGQSGQQDGEGSSIPVGHRAR